MIRPRVGPSSAARDLIAFAAQKATNKVISSQSPNEYEDLDKELEDLNARVSSDQGVRDLFATDNKNEVVEPLGDLNLAPLVDQDIPPLQLQLDPHEEPASQFQASQIPAAARKETMAPVIQIKRRASTLHVSSTLVPPPPPPLAATVKHPPLLPLQDIDPPPSSLDVAAPSIKPSLVKKRATKPDTNIKNPATLPASSQLLNPSRGGPDDGAADADDAPQEEPKEPLQVKGTRKGPAVTAFSLFSKSKRSMVKSSLPKEEQASIKSVNKALKDAWEEASDEVKGAFEVIAAQEGEEADAGGGGEGLGGGGGRMEACHEREDGQVAEEGEPKREKKSKSHKRKKSRNTIPAEGEGGEGEGDHESEGGERKKSSKRNKHKSSSDRDSKKRSKKSKRGSEGAPVEDDLEGGGEEMEPDEVHEGGGWKWGVGGGAQADAIIARSRDSSSFVVSGFPTVQAQDEGEGKGEGEGEGGGTQPGGFQTRVPTTGLVDARPIKMQRLTGPDPSLPVSLSLVDDYEAFEARFKSDVKGRMDDKGGLDLDDLPPGSSLEMCALLGRLLEPGMPLSTAGAGRRREVAESMIRVPCMALSMVVQRLVEVERAKAAAAQP